MTVWFRSKGSRAGLYGPWKFRIFRPVGAGPMSAEAKTQLCHLIQDKRLGNIGVYAKKSARGQFESFSIVDDAFILNKYS
ncbi:MAG: hypothetical protein KTR19_10710 [Hyphomicrobiales bacterium]|nr:hypothetical protein [Hyphomicrobiales bacterium]